MNSDKKQMFYEFTGFLVFFYLIPIVLLYLGYLPFWSRHLIIVIMGLILAAYAIQKGIKPGLIGFTKEGLKKSLIINLVLVFLASLLAYALVSWGIINPIGYDGTVLFFVFYVLISAPLQEYIFRSLMFYELDSFIHKKVWLKIIFSAAIYSMAHAMYQNVTVLAGTFFIGLIWGTVYSKTRNFWGVALSHALVGAFTVFLGLV